MKTTIWYVESLGNRYNAVDGETLRDAIKVTYILQNHRHFGTPERGAYGQTTHEAIVDIITAMNNLAGSLS